MRSFTISINCIELRRKSLYTASAWNQCNTIVYFKQLKWLYEHARYIRELPPLARATAMPLCSQTASPDSWALCPPVNNVSFHFKYICIYKMKFKMFSLVKSGGWNFNGNYYWVWLFIHLQEVFLSRIVQNTHPFTQFIV